MTSITVSYVAAVAGRNDPAWYVNGQPGETLVSVSNGTDVRYHVVAVGALDATVYASQSRLDDGDQRGATTIRSSSDWADAGIDDDAGLAMADDTGRIAWSANPWFEILRVTGTGPMTKRYDPVDCEPFHSLDEAADHATNLLLTEMGERRHAAIWVPVQVPVVIDGDGNVIEIRVDGAYVDAEMEFASHNDLLWTDGERWDRASDGLYARVANAITEGLRSTADNA